MFSKFDLNFTKVRQIAYAILQTSRLRSNRKIK
jgi:hypothetical protein